MAVCVYFRPHRSHIWYIEQHQRASVPDVCKPEDYGTPRLMYPPSEPSWQYSYDDYNTSRVSTPWFVQPNKPNPYKWVNPKLRKGPQDDQRQPSLPIHERSAGSRDFSVRSWSECSTSSQATNSISSIDPTPPFEPASLYKTEPIFQELWGTL